MPRVIWAYCLGIFLIFGLSGCLPDSINPVGDADKTTPDTALAGKWTGTMNKEPATVTITAKEGAVLQFRVETQDSDGKTDWVLLEGFPAEVGKRHYMNMKFRE